MWKITSWHFHVQFRFCELAKICHIDELKITLPVLTFEGIETTEEFKMEEASIDCVENFSFSHWAYSSTYFKCMQIHALIQSPEIWGALYTQ